jgi:hypothetical protein
MALLVGGIMAILEALAGHFVSSDQYFEQLADGEWALHGQVIPTAKANAVAAVWADVILYGSTLLDQILQVLISPSIT